jgi:hypothetical protein
MSKLPTTLNGTFVAAAILSVSFVTSAYEINNHADMSQEAAIKSLLATNQGQKLVTLGLKRVTLIDPRQTFPLAQELPRNRFCFGETVNPDGSVTQDPAVAQPRWGAGVAGRHEMTIAELFRYGACHEDHATLASGYRVFAHFYDPQNSGRGLESVDGPASISWTLQRGRGNATTQSNHYTYQDTRDYFYQALTRGLAPGFSQAGNELARRELWGKTFQSLGHVMHHLQDMAQPQHVRNDDHCDAALCAARGLKKPSGYEYYWRDQSALIRTLAASATAPMLFGLPREFWNINTTNALTSNDPNAS